MDTGTTKVYQVGEVVQFVEDGSELEDALLAQGFSAVTPLGDDMACTCTASSTDVTGLTGVDATWDGAEIVFESHGLIYQVSRFLGATSVRLTSAFSGDTGATTCIAFQLPASAKGGIQPRMARALP